MTIKELFTIVLAAMLLAGVSACNSDEMLSPPETQTPDGPEKPNAGNMKIRIKAGNAVFTATLRDNEAAMAFQAMLPMTLEMDELNRNEKYADLPARLPTESENPGTIRSGFTVPAPLSFFTRLSGLRTTILELALSITLPGWSMRSDRGGPRLFSKQRSRLHRKICNEFRFGLESTVDLQKNDYENTNSDTYGFGPVSGRPSQPRKRTKPIGYE